jgi:hypothetical protein
MIKFLIFLFNLILLKTNCVKFLKFILKISFNKLFLSLLLIYNSVIDSLNSFNKFIDVNSSK